MRAALYARYSDDRQNERSVIDQLAACRRHAEARGWRVVATFQDEAISGAAMANRPGVLAMVASAQAGAFDVLLIEDLDRLARSLEHHATIFNRLTHAGVAIATLSKDAIGIMDIGFKGMFSELYLVDLGQKTRRGMTANAERGLATGSRLYGYRSEPGGALAIVEAEAKVVRRIFDDYADGLTGRDIAAALNAERVPGPRGGAWNASTINGSRQRANGVLRTELYAGVKIWNRMDVRKDPVSGRRLPVMRAEADWRRTAVPQLAIVSAAQWSAVSRRKAIEAEASPAAIMNRRKPGLFSGLLKCGLCGASYTAASGGRLICAARRERGPSACANRRTVSRREIERRILDGLRDRLLAPEAVELYVRTYREAWSAEARRQVNERTPLQKRHAQLCRSIDRLVDAVSDGSADQRMLARMREQEAQCRAIEAELAALDETDPANPPVVLHPNAGRQYAALVAELQAALAQSSAEPGGQYRRSVDAVRSLVTRIDLTPTSTAHAAPVDITLHGDLARFITPAPDPRSMGRVVAGGGIEPPTCGL